MTTDEQVPELEPCPLCPDGGEPYFTKTVNGTNMAYVGCSQCGVQLKAQVQFLTSREEWQLSKDIVGIWNTRARVRDGVVATEKATYDTAHEARYAMSHPVHPDIVVLWFLALKSHWFENPTNMFYGQREQAKAYLYKWVETGELAEDHTTLEIAVASKFREWLESSWAATAPIAAPVENLNQND